MAAFGAGGGLPKPGSKLHPRQIGRGFRVAPATSQGSVSVHAILACLTKE